MRLSASSHLAMAIFCWLPPENAPAGGPERAAVDLDPVEHARRPPSVSARVVDQAAAR